MKVNILLLTGKLLSTAATKTGELKSVQNALGCECERNALHNTRQNLFASDFPTTKHFPEVYFKVAFCLSVKPNTGTCHWLNRVDVLIVWSRNSNINLNNLS